MVATRRWVRRGCGHKRRLVAWPSGGAITGTAGGAGLKAALTGALALLELPRWGRAAGIVGYGVGTAATNKFDENLGDRRKILNEANALEFKIRGGNASAAEVKARQELVGQLRNDPWWRHRAH